MVKVVGVKFRNAGKIYYFDPGDFDIHEEDNVIVETARGTEFGTASSDIIEVSEKEIVTPLKQVIGLQTKTTAKNTKKISPKKRELLIYVRKKSKNTGLI